MFLIPRATIKKRTKIKTVREIRELKRYTRKYLFTLKDKNQGSE